MIAVTRDVFVTTRASFGSPDGCVRPVSFARLQPDVGVAKDAETFSLCSALCIGKCHILPARDAETVATGEACSWLADVLMTHRNSLLSGVNWRQKDALD